MTRFDKAMEIVLAHEGGYVNHPNDPGGETKYGITKRTYPDVDIKNLTIAQAKAIYKRDFWDKGPYAVMKTDALAIKVFDTAINTGTKRALRFLQKAMNTNGAKLVEDGVIGSKSLNVLASMDEKAVLVAYRKIQAEYYNQLVVSNPKLSVFLRGWLNRANA